MVDVNLGGDAALAVFFGRIVFVVLSLSVTCACVFSVWLMTKYVIENKIGRRVVEPPPQGQRTWK